MKYFLNIKDYEWVPNSQTKLIYENEDGKLFMGPRINGATCNTIIVEASNQPIDGYYQIIRVVDSFPRSPKMKK